MTKEQLDKSKKLVEQIVSKAFTTSMENSLESDLTEEFIDEADWVDVFSVEDENTIRFMLDAEQQYWQQKVSVIYE